MLKQLNIEVDEQLLHKLKEYLRQHPKETQTRFIRDLLEKALQDVQLPKAPLKSSSWQQMGIDSFPEPRAELAREDC
jgi:hypothetical protein